MNEATKLHHQSWRNVPDEEREKWGDGPWQSEQDKAQWIDPETGLDCLIVRGPTGALCGYVGVPKSHPLYGTDYTSVPTEVYDASHGGLTFGKGCAHSEDPSRGVCHIPLNGRPDDVWWLGFDCGHLYDLRPAFNARNRKNGYSPWDFPETYCDWSYVEGTIRNLALAISQITEKPAQK